MSVATATYKVGDTYTTQKSKVTGVIKEIIPIGNEKVNRYFFSDVDEGALNLMSAAVDPARKLVIWAYASQASATVDKLLIYNYQTNKWTSGTTNASRIASSSTPSVALEGLDVFGKPARRNSSGEEQLHNAAHGFSSRCQR